MISRISFIFALFPFVTLGFAPLAPGALAAVPGWVHLQGPPRTASIPSSTSQPVFGQVYAVNVTDSPGQGPGIVAQLGQGPAGADPAVDPAWSWIGADYSSDLGYNDVYAGSLTAGAEGVYDYCFRFALDAGSWVYGDLDGSGNGYSPAQSGQLVVANMPDRGILQGPPEVQVLVDFDSPPVFGRVFLDGITDFAGQGLGLVAELGFGPVGTDPALDPSWQWNAAGFNLDVGLLDEYSAVITPTSPGSFDYCFRFACSGGPWLYADRDGTDNGYSSDQAGTMTVTEEPSLPDGSPCVVAGECISGHCVDGVCCGTSCDNICEACIEAWTGTVDGVCAEILAGTDPEDECMGLSTCNGAGSCEDPSGVPDDLEILVMSQNSPNPFNRLTSIRYGLDRSAALTLKVFDISGRLVNVLRNGGVEGPGWFETSWDGRDLRGRRVSSGVYIYRLQSGDRVRTKQMILLE